MICELTLSVVILGNSIVDTTVRFPVESQKVCEAAASSYYQKLSDAFGVLSDVVVGMPLPLKQQQGE